MKANIYKNVQVNCVSGIIYKMWFNQYSWWMMDYIVHYEECKKQQNHKF